MHTDQPNLNNSSLRFSFQVILGCVKLTVNVNSHKVVTLCGCFVVEEIFISCIVLGPWLLPNMNIFRHSSSKEASSISNTWKMGHWSGRIGIRVNKHGKENTAFAVKRGDHASTQEDSCLNSAKVDLGVVSFFLL